MGFKNVNDVVEVYRDLIIVADEYGTGAVTYCAGWYGEYDGCDWNMEAVYWQDGDPYAEDTAPDGLDDCNFVPEAQKALADTRESVYDELIHNAAYSDDYREAIRLTR